MAFDHSDVIHLEMKLLFRVKISNSSVLSGVRELILREEERLRSRPWEELCISCPAEWYQLPV